MRCFTEPYVLLPLFAGQVRSDLPTCVCGQVVGIEEKNADRAVRAGRCNKTSVRTHRGVINAAFVHKFLDDPITAALADEQFPPALVGEGSDRPGPVALCPTKPSTPLQRRARPVPSSRSDDP